MAARKPENSSPRSEQPPSLRGREPSVSQPTATAPPTYHISTMQVSPRFAVLFMMLLAGSAPAVQLPTNKAPFEGINCTPIKVEGDATYCIEGRVCSSGTLVGSQCPKRGDIALSNCWTSHPSYDPVRNNCFAHADAECKAINGTEVVGCVFPSIAVAPVTAQTPANTPVDAGTNALANTASAPSAVETSMMATTFSASNSDDNNNNSEGNGSKGLGALLSVAVAAAVVVVAVAAVGVMKRRRDKRQNQDNSSRVLSCVELSTPV
ncbi:hypothetical protein FI667_g8280, partial [Globisporangium splendens]